MICLNWLYKFSGLICFVLEYRHVCEASVKILNILIGLNQKPQAEDTAMPQDSSLVFHMRIVG